MTKNPNHSFQKEELPHSPSKGVVTEKIEKDAQTRSTSNATKNKSAMKNREF
ncbi:hypothetical protein [Lachnoclostridium phytofermentans]|uniref:hypothetical protein n=1 Tax=Lachnoclostridium phytofermentans TaxID=66219 RepID=UPI0002E97A8D|nr:hypothetical protein [Lachnoclostridium phytofermentans]